MSSPSAKPRPLVFLTLILIVIVGGVESKSSKLIPCSASATDGKPSRADPNKCFDARDANKKPLPNCVNVGPSDSDPQWACAECTHNCDCGTGEYCPKGPGQFAGTCRKIADDDRLGRACVTFGEPGTRGAETPRYGVDDKLVCGSPVFSANGTFVRYDWIGACVQRICRQCEGGPWSWTIATAARHMVPVTGSASSTASNYSAHLSRDEGSLTCPGSICNNGDIARSGSWTFEVLPHGLIAGCVTLLALIYALLWCMAVYKCCAGRRRIKLDNFLMSGRSKRKRAKSSSKRPDDGDDAVPFRKGTDAVELEVVVNKNSDE